MTVQLVLCAEMHKLGRVVGHGGAKSTSTFAPVVPRVPGKISHCPCGFGACGYVQHQFTLCVIITRKPLINVSCYGHRIIISLVCAEGATVCRCPFLEFFFIILSFLMVALGLCVWLCRIVKLFCNIYACRTFVLSSIGFTLMLVCCCHLLVC